MRTPSKMTPDLAAEALRRHRAGESIRSLATAYDVAHGTMQRALKRAGKREAETAEWRRLEDVEYKRRRRVAAAVERGDATVAARPELSRRQPADTEDPVPSRGERDDGRDVSCSAVVNGERIWALSTAALTRVVAKTGWEWPMGTGCARRWLPHLVAALHDPVAAEHGYDWTGVLIEPGDDRHSGRRLIQTRRHGRLWLYGFRGCRADWDVRGVAQRCWTDLHAGVPGTEHLYLPWKRRPNLADHRVLVRSVTIGPPSSHI